MKYIKTYEKISTIKYSNLDQLINKHINFYEKLKSDFSKYLTPTIVNYKNVETEIFLFKPDFGILILVDNGYYPQPYITIGNIYPIYKIENKWIRKKEILRVEKNWWKLNKKDEIPKLINTLDRKYKEWGKRKLDRDIKKYNL